MKKFGYVFAVLCIVFAAAVIASAQTPKLPPLESGDLIFQTSSSNQSLAILFATASAFTHMGIIRTDGDKTVVIEAGDKVRETPLSAWIHRGRLQRTAVYRLPNLTPRQKDEILASAKSLYGKPYDIFFSFNNDAIYCSELPYLAFRAAGISLGRLQKVSELNIDNWLVKNLIEKRWERDQECKVAGFTFEQCYKHILDQDLVTPSSIAHDPKLNLIFSNYPL